MLGSFPMRAARPRWSIGAVNAPRNDLGVEFERNSDPIAGEIRHPDGSTTRFQGYVQLIAALERAHGGAAEGAAPGPEGGENGHAG